MFRSGLLENLFRASCVVGSVRLRAEEDAAVFYYKISISLDFIRRYAHPQKRSG